MRAAPQLYVSLSLIMKRTVSELLPVIIFGTLLIGWVIGLWYEAIPYVDWALYSYAVLIVTLYFSILWSVSLHMGPMKKGKETAGVFLFLTTSMMLVIAFGFGWWVFGNFSSAAGPLPTRIDAFYFSVVAFTTLGFGDFAPNSDAGKIYLAAEALMGITHMVAFFSIVISRIIPNAPED